MNRYDTLKLAFPSELLTISARNRKRLFDRRIVEGDRPSDKLTLQPAIVKSVRGLSAIELSDTKAVLELSAKTLGPAYFDGISARTIEQAISKALPDGITGDVQSIIEKSNVARADVTCNVHCESIRYSLAELGMYPRSPHTVVKDYQRRQIESLVWTSTRKTNNLRLTAYDKQVEASRKRDKTEWSALNIDRFNGYLRFEGNLRNLSDMRLYHGIASGQPMYLPDILNSRVNALGTILDTFLPPDLEPTDTHTDQRGVEGIKQEGYLALFRRCNWQWNFVRAYVLAGYSRKSNPTKVMKEVRDLFDLHNPNTSTGRITEYRRIRTAVEESFEGEGGNA